MTVEDIFNNLVCNEKLNTIPSAYIVKIALETIKILEQNNLIDAGDIVTLPISALVRLNCDCDTANLTIVIGGQVVTAQNLALVVEKE